MPPVQRIISTPSSAIWRMAAVMAALSSPGVTWAAMVQPYAASFSSSTGVKASWISPFCTSLPVVTTPKVLARKGRSCKRGSGPATLAGLLHSGLFNDQRNDAGAAELAALFHGKPRGPGGDHHAAQSVDGPDALCIR